MGRSLLVTLRFALGAAPLAACVPPVTSKAPARAAADAVAEASSAGPAWNYAVSLDAQGGLTVEATFANGVNGLLVLDGDAAPFLDGVVQAGGDGEHSLIKEAGGFRAACAGPCRVRYRFRLADAATALHDADTALAAGGGYFAPSTTWLLHPDRNEPGTVRFHVETPPGLLFASGVRPAPGAEAGTYESPISRFFESSFSAFGDVGVYDLPDAGTVVAVARGTGVDDAVLVDWTLREVAAIDGYFGKNPNNRVLVLLVPGTSDVMRGVTLGGGGASTLIRIGTKFRTKAALDDDWVLPHELIHTRFPDLSREHTWFSEGLASYVEPIARLQAGLLTKERFWRDLMDGLPQGLPQAGDTGLAGNSEWGRVYWGGSLYFLLADLEIRERTKDASSLEDALRGVARTGANVEVSWPLERVLDVADAATRTRVFHDLYDRMALHPGTEDLESLWKRLGLMRDGHSVRFDDGASGAWLRRSVTEP
jgi:predicted metalloprotease with PDZ domain